MYGKKGLVYIFDMNGYHRQSYSAQKDSTPPRELDFVFPWEEKLHLINKKEL